MKYQRVTVNHAQMGGVACVRGLRIPVSTVVGMVADGMSVAEIIGSFPDFEPDDIGESLAFAAESLLERSLPMAEVA